MLFYNVYLKGDTVKKKAFNMTEIKVLFAIRAVKGSATVNSIYEVLRTRKYGPPMGKSLIGQVLYRLNENRYITYRPTSGGEKTAKTSPAGYLKATREFTGLTELWGESINANA